MKTVLMATERDSGREVMIAGPDVPMSEQSAQVLSLFESGSNEYSKVGIFDLVQSRAVVALKPIQTTETETKSKKKSK